MNAMKLAIPLFVALAYGPAQGLATPILGATLDNYAVLAAAGVTCVAPCNIGGNVGSSPTASGGTYTFTFGMVDDGNAGTAQTELTTSVGTVNSAGSFTTITAGLLGTFMGGVYSPGNYEYVGAALLGGGITLAGGADPNPVWNFKFNSLTAGTGSTVSVTGANLNNAGIYWTTAFDAALNGATFAGNVMAGSKITSDGTAMVISCGRLLAQTESVTLNNDTISIGCGIAGDTGFGSNGFDQGNASDQSVPEPATLLLFGFGLAGLFTFRKRLFPVA